MDDDDDVIASAELDRPAGALPHVDGKVCFLQHDRAFHPPLQTLDFSCFHGLPRRAPPALFEFTWIFARFARHGRQSAKGEPCQGRE